MYVLHIERRREQLEGPEFECAVHAVGVTPDDLDKPQVSDLPLGGRAPGRLSDRLHRSVSRLCGGKVSCRPEDITALAASHIPEKATLATTTL